MQTRTARFPAIAFLIALAIVILPGCGAKDKPAEKKIQQAVTNHFTAQVKTVKKAKSLKVAFDNPDMDRCPVCGEPINYESFVSIGKKRYALCSNECAERLQSDPARFVAAANETPPSVPSTDPE